MFNREGHQVNVVEARNHLLQFGEISKLEPLHEEAVNTMKLPGAVFVEYMHFDPGRDIISVCCRFWMPHTQTTANTRVGLPIP